MGGACLGGEDFATAGDVAPDVGRRRAKPSVTSASDRSIISVK